MTKTMKDSFADTRPVPTDIMWKDSDGVWEKLYRARVASIRFSDGEIYDLTPHAQWRPRPLIRVYGAGKFLRHDAELWIGLLANGPRNLVLSSTWQQALLNGAKDTTPADVEAGWKSNLDDLKNSDVVVVLPSPNLNGALVEVGIAIGLGLPVILIGNCEAYRTWVSLPGIKRVETIASALAQLATMGAPNGS